MNFQESTKTFFYLFFLFGQCKKQRPLKKTENKVIFSLKSISTKDGSLQPDLIKPSNKIVDAILRCCSYIPVILLGILNVTMTLSALIFQPRSKGRFSESNNTVAHIFIACSFITISTILLQHLRKSDLIREIRKEVSSLELNTEKKLKAGICFRRVRNMFVIKILFIIGSYIQAIFMSLMGSMVMHKFSICPFSYGLSIITDISCLYAIFCIDVVHKILVEINTVLKLYDRKIRASHQVYGDQDSLPEQLQPAAVVEKIEVLKQVYLSAWILTHKINDYFGWFFISYLIQQFIDLAADLFWLFLINHDDFNYKIMRK